jgi:hypothetical protein
MLRSDTTAFRATTSHHRDLAHTVLSTTYAQEKQWVDSARDVFPAGDLSDDAVTWIVATVDDEPAGVVRIHYAPPLHRYQEYGLESLGGDGHSGDGHSDGSPSFGGAGVDAFIRDNDIAEIGRFAVLPAYRHRIRVVFWLMRMAGVDTLERGYSHYVTDVFEGEEHSPYNFHTRVLGFRPVATHEMGEMDCLHRRITLILNLKQAYRRLRKTKNRLYRFLAEGLSPQVRRQLSA